VIHLLNLESAETENHSASEKRAAIFEKIYDQNKWTFSRLLDLPMDELARHIESHGGGAVKPAKLAGHLREFARAKQRGF
jgi:hypothetical protein